VRGRTAAPDIKLKQEAEMSKLGKLEFCIPALVMAGCAAEAVSPGETAQAEASGNTIVLSELARSALTTARLDATNAASMAGTAEARTVLALAVGCALDSRQTISFTVNGVTYVDTGGVGIAPGWTTSALTVTQAAWVSACLFAHVNDVSSLIWISLRGAEANLAPTAVELTGYKIEEGAFWGNAFIDLGPVTGYSCDGVDQAANDDYADLPLRQCAQWDGVAASNRSPCGISYAGRCSTVCATASAPYAGCSFLGGPVSGPVVTIFLAGTPGSP
jgi:hypothetical protein